MQIPPTLRLWTLAALVLLTPARWASGQTTLTLDEAIARALERNPAIRGADAGSREAAARADQARSAFLPRLDLSEAWQRGNQPVYVFGSLLAQRRFTERNFALPALNHPDPLTNYRTALTMEQVVFDGWRSSSARTAANLGTTLAELGARDVALSLRVGVTEAFGQVLVAEAERLASHGAVESATEDLKRVERRRDGGMATEADVLAIQVHLARMRAREISAVSQEEVARATLNDMIGEPLDAAFALATPAMPSSEPPALDELEADARAHRPDVLMAAVKGAMAEAEIAGSKAGFYPQASIAAGYEWNGGTFGDRAPSWNVGAYFRWNLFAGAADAARLREAKAAADRVSAEREALDGRVRVEVRAARADMDAARARQEVGRFARAQAEESQRIIRNRYEAGLAGINDLLRAANAVLDADSLYTGAVVDLMVSLARLDRARGR